MWPQPWIQPKAMLHSQPQSFARPKGDSRWGRGKWLEMTVPCGGGQGGRGPEVRGAGIGGRGRKILILHGGTWKKNNKAKKWGGGREEKNWVGVGGFNPGGKGSRPHPPPCPPPTAILVGTVGDLPTGPPGGALPPIAIRGCAAL